jgi:hypothetical protein
MKFMALFFFVEKSIIVDIYLDILVHWYKFPRTALRRFASLPPSGGTRTSERQRNVVMKVISEGSGLRCHGTYDFVTYIGGAM